MYWNPSVLDPQHTIHIQLLHAISKDSKDHT